MLGKDYMGHILLKMLCVSGPNQTNTGRLLEIFLRGCWLNPSGTVHGNLCSDEMGHAINQHILPDRLWWEVVAHQGRG